ncbi:DNA repair protein (mre11) [Edhazardia aedis USNM 41457]|uniref:DNA repair protein (Mre11) n=1 Tax=Edhazardia aedis (strain USNM 41457) TaxID=1003232 RepID=J9DST9_EDHAE|nr:DNA repair protein (mre11) [Edhazardia aedis USNM 41457]|eukprot:EJW04387.1 DNA repair protein (mre11) [Edhazardia aedis USNM 41457]
MRILLTSDNHLGYKEGDPIIGNDSFQTFEETLSLAFSLNADFVLQGGDLFHENTPSKDTLSKTFKILGRYCIGDRPIEFQTNHVLNFDNENINISLPIISIHGNHDDPCGISKESIIESIAPTYLINYIGKHKNHNNLLIKPLLVHKNDVKVAIYGVGNVRDNRMYKIFMEGRIKYDRPEDYSSYVNILLLHQNRIPYNGNDYVPIERIESWFDLVIFGHEHEPLLYYVDSKDFTVIQCGSTVRTSLCEAEQGSKYAYLLSINDNIDIEKIELKTVRPFVFDNLIINNCIDDCEAILVTKINEMIDGLNMPLVRLRVEHEGNVINRSRFGQLFKGKIANNWDILKYKRKRKTKKILHDDENEQIEPQINTENKSDFTSGLFINTSLSAIPESLFVECVKKCVETGNKTVFEDIVNFTVKNVSEKLQDKVLTTNMLHEEIFHLKNEINRQNEFKKKHI